MGATTTFHWADYLVFVVVLLGSAIFGVVLGIIGRRGKAASTKDFVKGGGEMSALPVALSTLASFLSAPSVLGTPAEVYGYGTMWTMSMVGYLIAVPIMAFLFLPVYHGIDMTSAYEYLERRFNKYVKLLGSASFLLMMWLYMAVAIYAPAAAFSQVTGMNISFSILGVGLICMFYTSVGGMKAAIYVDTFQMCIILLGLLGLVVVGTISVGSLSDVWRISKSGERLIFDNFNPDPTERHSFWSLSFGMAFVVMSVLGANQAMIQRFLTIKELKQVQLSIFYALIALIVYTFLVVMLGLVMYAYYSHCDPISYGQVTSGSQLLPLFLMDMLGDYHGLPGLFSAAVFSATLSTVSAGIMGSAAVLVVDFIKPGYSYFKGKSLDGGVMLWLLRGLSVLVGGIVIGLAYVSPYMGNTLLQVALSVFGMVGGPMLGIFTVGIFFPFVNSAGALIGGVVSFILTFWVSIGGILHGDFPKTLPLSTAGCMVPNLTIADASQVNAPMAFFYITPFNNTQPMEDEDGPVDEVYNVSYLYYALIGWFVVLVVGIVVSLLTGCNKNRKLEPELLFRYSDVCGCVCSRATAVGRWWLRPVAQDQDKEAGKGESDYEYEDVDVKVGDITKMNEPSLPVYQNYVPNGDVTQHHAENGDVRKRSYAENGDITKGADNLGYVPDIISTRL